MSSFNASKFLEGNENVDVCEMLDRAYERGVKEGYEQAMIMGVLGTWDELLEDTPYEEVKIEGAVNVKAHPMTAYKVRLSYGDLKLIVAMIRDYINGMDKMYEDGDIKVNPFEYMAYYRNKFLKIADNISLQIEYDYDEHLKKCLKKLGKESKSDVGEEALSLALKRR